MSLNLAISHLTEPEFRVLISSGARSSEIYGMDFEALMKSSYRFVKQTMPELLGNGDFDGVILAAIRDRGVGIFDCDIDTIPIKESMAFVLWLKDEAEKLAELEREHLKSEPNAELFAAGIQELDIFGEYNVIDTLTGGDMTKEDYYWSLPYERIFQKQLKNLIEGRINKKINDNRKSNKGKK